MTTSSLSYFVASVGEGRENQQERVVIKLQSAGEECSVHNLDCKLF